MKLEKRGLLRPDYFADITIFNPETIHDVATFDDPNRTSVGVEYVFVNGVLSLDHGKVTGQLGGRPLRGPGYAGAEGPAPAGKLQGAITDAAGWPVLRAQVNLLDAAGKVLGTSKTRKEGRYEIGYAQECRDCKLRVERRGFASAEKTVDYNGANSLWFSFVLTPQP